MSTFVSIYLVFKGGDLTWLLINGKIVIEILNSLMINFI